MTADSGPLVKATGIRQRFGHREVLQDVHIEIYPGEIVALIGPNGSGKSTLARILLGILKPTAGTVTRRDGLHVGYVPQRLPIDDVLPLSVARLLTLTARASRERMLQVLEEVRAPHLLDEAAITLSGGELQRVLIARALLAEPELLVLDEPVQGVDFTGEVALYEKIAAIRERHGCGILLVSHDLHVVMAASDRVLCLNGHVCCAGVPSEVAEAPEYRRLFGPRAAGTVAIYRHHHDHTHDLHGEVVESDDSSGDHDHKH